MNEIFLEAFKDLFYKDIMLDTLKTFLEQDKIDEEKIINAGYDIYVKDTHITYEYHKIREGEKAFLGKLLEEKALTKELYNKISYFIDVFTNILTYGYSKRCLEVSDDLESNLYSEDILPDIFRPSAVFKNNLTRDFTSFSGKPSIEMDPRACDVYTEIQKANVPDYVRKNVHLVHYRLHYVANFYYELLRKKDYKDAFGAFWRSRYLNILILTALTLYTLRSEKEFYETFFEEHEAPMLIIAKNGKIVKANKSALKFYGYTLKDITSLYIWQIESFEKQIGFDGKPYFLFKHKTNHGNIKYVEIFSSPVRIENKDYTASIVIDITDMYFYQRVFMLLKQLEDAYLTSKSKKDFLENVVKIFKIQDEIKSVNLSLKSNKSLEIVNNDACCLEDTYLNPHLIIPMLENNKFIGNLYVCTNNRFLKYLTEFHKEISNIINRALDNFYLKDVLEERKAIFESLTENLKEGILLHDIDKIYYINKYLLNTLGYKKDDIKSISIFDIISPKHTEELIKSIIEEKPINKEITFIKRNGSYIKGFCKSNVINVNDRKYILCQIIIEEKEEEELRQINTILDNLEEPSVIFRILNEKDIQILKSNDKFNEMFPQKPKYLNDIFSKVEMESIILSLMASKKFKMRDIKFGNIVFDINMFILNSDKMIGFAVFKQLC